MASLFPCDWLSSKDAKSDLNQSCCLRLQLFKNDYPLSLIHFNSTASSVAANGRTDPFTNMGEPSLWSAPSGMSPHEENTRKISSRTESFKESDKTFLIVLDLQDIDARYVPPEDRQNAQCGVAGRANPKGTAPYSPSGIS
jgi:hypothetical protein